MKTQTTSECFDLSNLRNVVDTLLVQSEDQQSEHSDVLDICFHLNKTINSLIAGSLTQVFIVHD